MASINSKIAFAFASTALSFGVIAPNPILAATLTPDDLLVVDFTLSPTLSAVPNALLLNLNGFIQVNQPFTERTAKLFDSNMLLGTATNSIFGTYTGLLGSLSSSNSWKSFSSPWNSGNPTTINFDSLVDSSIDGRIEFSIATGEIEFDLDRVDVWLFLATNTAGGWRIDGLNTTSVRVVKKSSIPEPDPLLGLSLFGLGLLLKKKLSS
ncbi:hypothetical protein H6F77_16170 [Microcoleus sp. FACHB-831]|nr:hypothetical protein [Microcoleus sp. FACHB-831]